MRINTDKVIWIILIIVAVPAFWGWHMKGEANTEEIDKSFFYGTWVVSSCAGTFYTTLRPDGTTITKLVKRDSGKTYHLSNGVWAYRNNCIVWIRNRDTSRTKAGNEDINPVTIVNKNQIRLRETDGTSRIFTRVTEQ